MFCSKCGTQISEGAKFCTNCGEKVLVSEETYDEKSIVSNNTDLKIQNGESNYSEKKEEASKNDRSSYQAKSDVQYLEEYEQFIAAFFGITGSLDKKKNKFIEGYSHSFKFYDSKPNILKFLMDLRFGDKSLPIHDTKAILSCIFLIPFTYLYSLGAKKSAIISGIIVALIISLVMIAPAGDIWIIWLPFMCIVFYLMPKFFHVEFSKRMKLVENEADHNAV